MQAVAVGRALNPAASASNGGGTGGGTGKSTIDEKLIAGDQAASPNSATLETCLTCRPHTTTYHANSVTLRALITNVKPITTCESSAAAPAPRSPDGLFGRDRRELFSRQEHFPYAVRGDKWPISDGDIAEFAGLDTWHQHAGTRVASPVVGRLCFMKTALNVHHSTFHNAVWSLDLASLSVADRPDLYRALASAVVDDVSGGAATPGDWMMTPFIQSARHNATPQASWTNRCVLTIMPATSLRRSANKNRKLTSSAKSKWQVRKVSVCQIGSKDALTSAEGNAKSAIARGRSSKFPLSSTIY